MDIFDQALEEMEPMGICAKCLGGGMINMDKSKKKITIYGKSKVNVGHCGSLNCLTYCRYYYRPLEGPTMLGRRIFCNLGPIIRILKLLLAEIS